MRNALNIAGNKISESVENTEDTYSESDTIEPKRIYTWEDMKLIREDMKLIGDIMMLYGKLSNN